MDKLKCDICGITIPEGETCCNNSRGRRFSVTIKINKEFEIEDILTGKTKTLKSKDVRQLLKWTELTSYKSLARDMEARLTSIENGLKFNSAIGQNIFKKK